MPERVASSFLMVAGLSFAPRRPLFLEGLSHWPV